MPRQQARKQFLNFVQGLNTESSPLVFPENTAKDLDNVDLDRDGSIKRRRGIDFEALGAYSDTTTALFAEADLQTYAVSAHEWESVNNDDSLNFLVIQIGGTLYFHQLGATVVSTSIIGLINLENLRVRDDYTTFVMDTAVGKGRLFVVSRGLSPLYISYDADTNRFTATKLTVKVRDVTGIPESRSSSPVPGDISPVNPVNPEDDTGDVLVPGDIPDFTEIPPLDGIFA